MRKIFFILILVCLLKVNFVSAYQSSKLFLKQADEYYALGKKDALAGNLDEAMKYLQKAVAINPYLAEAHYELAKVYEEKGEFERAEKEYQTAVSLSPKLRPPLTYPKLEEIEEKIPTEKEKEEGILREAEEWAEELEAKESAERIAEERKELIPKIEREVTKEPFVEKEPGAIEATYIETTKRDLYPAERKEPTIGTILDPYHPSHEDFRIPYYKDRQGLKITENIGVDVNYEMTEEPVPLETYILEAKEFNQTTDEELQDYISTNDKRVTEAKVYLFHKEDWPKFTYTYHTEEVRRFYPAKLLWSGNTMWSENIDYHDFDLKYTIPNLRYLGYLILNPGYRRTKRTSDNDPSHWGDQNRYHLALTTAPWDDLQVYLEYNYLDEDRPREPTIYTSKMKGIDTKNYRIELRKEFPVAKLKITPHYFWNEERWDLVGGDNEFWEKDEFGLDIEKKIGGKWEFNFDWDYLALDRRRPPTASPDLIKARVLTFNNKISYEIARDLKLGLSFDYGNGLNFDGFDYFAIGPSIRFLKPGLVDFDIGYKYYEFYQANDHLNTIYFKFKHLAPGFFTAQDDVSAHLSTHIGWERLRYEEHENDTNLDSDAKTVNTVLKIEGMAKGEHIFGGIKATVPVYVGEGNERWYEEGVLTQTNKHKYNWSRVDGFVGYPFVSWLNPYLGLRWSNQKLDMWSITSGGVPSTDVVRETVKSIHFLSGIRGNGKFTPRFFWNYGLEYLLPMDVKVSNTYFPGLEEREPAEGYTWEARGGLSYLFHKNFVLNTHLYYGKMHWEGGEGKPYYLGSLVKWPENNTEYWGGDVGLNWKF